MQKLIDWFEGKKTYFIILIGLVVTVLYWLGIIPQALYQQIMVLLGLGGAAALRSSIKK